MKKFLLKNGKPCNDKSFESIKTIGRSDDPNLHEKSIKQDLVYH